ncbi:hypothetical protein LCGC14_1892010 [marine sediment metagenome]|uniref:Uncharacterized protein n=1 Tax=marine sediment metagenome TaxID=412755 RepID=A0A0F9FZE9_9ZZZZ
MTTMQALDLAVEMIVELETYVRWKELSSSYRLDGLNKIKEVRDSWRDAK